VNVGIVEFNDPAVVDNLGINHGSLIGDPQLKSPAAVGEL
jgi:hypothetical protein